MPAGADLRVRERRVDDPGADLVSVNSAGPSCWQANKGRAARFHEPAEAAVDEDGDVLQITSGYECPFGTQLPRAKHRCICRSYHASAALMPIISMT